MVRCGSRRPSPQGRTSSPPVWASSRQGMAMAMAANPSGLLPPARQQHCRQLLFPGRLFQQEPEHKLIMAQLLWEESAPLITHTVTLNRACNQARRRPRPPAHPTTIAHVNRRIIAHARKHTPPPRTCILHHQRARCVARLGERPPAVDGALAARHALRRGGVHGGVAVRVRGMVEVRVRGRVRARILVRVRVRSGMRAQGSPGLRWRAWRCS